MSILCSSNYHWNPMSILVCEIYFWIFLFMVWVWNWDFRCWSWLEMLLETTRRTGSYLDMFYWLWEMMMSLESFLLVWQLLMVVFFQTSIQFFCQRNHMIKLQRNLQNLHPNQPSPQRKLSCWTTFIIISLYLSIYLFTFFWWCRDNFYKLWCF